MPNLTPLLVAGLLCWCSFHLRAADPQLPLLGDSTSGVVSLEEEHRVGRAWVRVLRAQAPLLDDPQVYGYVENLLSSLASYSQLPDRRLSLVLINNSSLNAFAAPGGIVGVNAGLFLNASTESQFASVLAHELSHLSQRHYAMGLEEQRRNTPWQLATTLASILVMAAADGQAGAAAMMSSQAAFAQKNLAFSRTNEQEADRIGMQVLANAGYDPKAMPEMFAQMQRSTAYLGQRAPEFLLTHPVTESRIADALNRAAQLPAQGARDSLEYRLMQTRVSVLLARAAPQALSQYRDAVRSHGAPAAHYGLAFSALRSNQLSEAAEAAATLLEKDPTRLSYLLLQAEIRIKAGAGEQAAQQLDKLRTLYPGNHAITRLLANALHAAERYRDEALVLREHSRRYGEDIQLWYELAEAYGLSGNLLGLHQARAEYFLLKGAVPEAETQLEQALKMGTLSDGDRAQIELRLKEAKQIRKDLQF